MQKTTQVRETLNVMDGAPPNCDFATKTNKGIFISKGLGLILFLIYLLSIVATILIVYNFTVCPSAEKFPDLLEYQTFRNDCTTEAGQTAAKMNFVESMETSTLNMGKSSYPSTTLRVVEDSNVYQPESSTAVENVRLPRSMHPEKYYIKLTPYIYQGNFTFDGEVDIILNVTESTTNVTLHAVELSIHETNLYKYVNGEKKESVRIVSATEDPIRQFYVLHLNTQLIAGELYWLHMKYVGKLNDYLDGFYRSSYVENNKTRWIAVTQFQPTDARKAFPCLDEPALKARFTVSLARRTAMSSLSNMNRLKEPQPHEYLEDYVWDHYEESLPMSTYLVAFAITDFEKLSEGNFSVWARREAISSAKYALEVGPKILNFFQDFYQIKFPLPKLDMIAIPDFNAGAMENWGLLTFRETTMLYSVGVSARVAQARVATVVAHELAHQWFGNLVTPRWWSDIWLNEGFASYVEYIAIDVVEKSWKSMEHFVINEIQNVFTLDALATSHQISVEVGNPNQINEIFDKISYGKGSAIIRMMNHFLTDEVFNRGITAYLQGKMYGSAEQDDLWEALTGEARRSGLFAEGVSVKRIMDTWTLQTGFPVVTVTRSYEGGQVKFVQERFVLLNSTESKPAKPLWWVPISYTTRSLAAFNDTRTALWLKAEEEVQYAIDVSTDDWIIVNIQQTGFYRVNYDITNWELIIAQLNDPVGFERIHPINRAQLVDDAMNLALNGRLAYTTALDLTKYLAHERSYVPWKSGLVAMGYIDAMLSKGPYYLEYKTHVLRLLEGVYRSVGFSQRPGDSMPTVYQRADVLTAACHLQHADCITKSVMLFHEWMMSRNPDINSMEPDVRGAAYCGALGVGGAVEWQFAWRRFRAARVASERELLLTALGCTRHPHLLSRYLEFAIRNDTGIRKQDVFRVFAAVASSVTGQPIAFAFVRTNWDRMKKYLGSESTNLDPIIKVVTKRLNQQHELDELKKFAKKHKSEFGRTMSQAIERTQANIQWMERNSQTIVDWLLESKMPDAEASS